MMKEKQEKKCNEDQPDKLYILPVQTEIAYDIPMGEIQNLLLDLGATPDYGGFWQASYALWLLAREPERINLVSKWLYPDVAKSYGIVDKSVQRNIRTLIKVIWKENRPELEEIQGFSADKEPKCAKFLSLLWAHLVRLEMKKERQKTARSRRCAK